MNPGSGAKTLTLSASSPLLFTYDPRAKSLATTIAGEEFCVDVYSHFMANGTALQLYRCCADCNQQFDVHPGG